MNVYFRTIFRWLAGITTVILPASYSSFLSAAQNSQTPVLVFVCPGERSSDICTVKADGTGFRRLTNGDIDGKHSINTAPAWSPNGRRIAFLSNRAGTDVLDVHVMDADGSNPSRITRNTHAAGKYFSVSPPQWSPDGKRIAYVVDNPSGMGRGTLWVANVEGPGQRSSGITTVVNRVFQWFSASKVAFIAEGWPGVSAVDVVSLRVQPLVSYRLGITSMSWSPDRKRLAFSAGAQPFILLHDLYVMNADSSNVRLVTRGAGAQQYVWSPDGEHIALTQTVKSGMSRPDNIIINSIKPDGRDRRVLTNNTESNENPAWSPDGKYIAFESHRTPERSGIYIIDAGGTDERFLFGGNHPAWRPCASCPP